MRRALGDGADARVRRHVDALRGEGGIFRAECLRCLAAERALYANVPDARKDDAAKNAFVPGALESDLSGDGAKGDDDLRARLKQQGLSGDEVAARLAQQRFTRESRPG